MIFVVINEQIQSHLVKGFLFEIITSPYRCVTDVFLSWIHMQHYFNVLLFFPGVWRISLHSPAPLLQLCVQMWHRCSSDNKLEALRWDGQESFSRWMSHVVTLLRIILQWSEVVTLPKCDKDIQRAIQPICLVFGHQCWHGFIIRSCTSLRRHVYEIWFDKTLNNWFRRSNKP